ncbi:MAG: T9SS type A sorting domain-containing protein [bacterium]|nr:T9SS type A sorting domain-containing protein [bacterium]
MIKRSPLRRNVPFLFLLLFNSSYLLYANEFIISNAQEKQAAPDISRGNNNLLTVWEDYRNSTSTDADIWAQLIDLSGSPTGNNFTISNKSYAQRAPVVQWGYNSYLVVWEQGIGSGNFHIYGQLIAPDGTLIGSEIPISTVNNKSQQPAISFGNSKWLVVWADFRNTIEKLNIYGQMIDSNGALIDTAITISTALEEQLDPTIAWAESKKSWLVIWEDKRSVNSDIWGQIIDSSGTRIDSNFPISQAVQYQDHPDVASNGTEWLIVWADHRNNSSYSIYAQFIDTSTFLIDSNMLLAETLSCNLYSPKVVWNGNRWVIAYVKNNQIVYDNISISNSSQDAFFPELTTIGNNCLAVWQDNRNNNWDDYDIYANLFTPAGIEEKWSEATSRLGGIKLTVTPNPFVGTTIIHANNSLGQGFSFAVYDISGKLVKSFPLNTESPLNQTTWNGKDNSGKPVPPGIYFCKSNLNSKNKLNITKKIIRLTFDNKGK